MCQRNDGAVILWIAFMWIFTKTLSRDVDMSRPAESEMFFWDKSVFKLDAVWLCNHQKRVWNKISSASIDTDLSC